MTAGDPMKNDINADSLPLWMNWIFLDKTLLDKKISSVG